jgi:Tetratricopeptide repeat
MVWARVLYNGAWYAMESGQYGVAEKMARVWLAVREEALNQYDAATLDSPSILGDVLRYRGKYEEAEEMHPRAVAGYEKVLGVDHPDTLTSAMRILVFDSDHVLSHRWICGLEIVDVVIPPRPSASVQSILVSYDGLIR